MAAVMELRDLIIPAVAVAELVQQDQIVMAQLLLAAQAVLVM
jgi:hypothetical protein